MEIVRVKDDNQIKDLAALAKNIWNEHYIDIIGQSQVDYMIENFQSFDAIKKQIETDGYEYYFLYDNGENCGYIGIQRQEDKMFLSKLYVKKDCRKKGYASKAFLFLEDLCKKINVKKIYLTCNKDNKESLNVYLKKGFRKVKEQKQSIGNGFYMDDYIMEKELSK